MRTKGTDTEVTLERAIEVAASLLRDSRRPLIYGLSSTENGAHRVAYEIAEVLGGVIDNTSSVCHGPSIVGTQESGEPIGSLAEVRERAEMVMYWGANPLASHPRHLSRYIRVAGEKAVSRSVWVVDIRKTVTATKADRFIQLAPGSDLEVICVLRALIRGHHIDVKSVGGLSLKELESIAECMRNTRYGVLFYGLGLTQSPGKHHNIAAIIRLVQDLNSFTKWSLMPMRGHYNVTGANKTCTWTTGYPFAVDFARGYPRYQPGEYSVVDMLVRGEADCLLNVAADPAAHLPADAIRHMSRIPVVNLDPKRNLTSLLASVNIPTAIAGIECDGIAVRMDGLPLYLKRVVSPPEGVFPDREVLQMLHTAIVKR